MATINVYNTLPPAEIIKRDRDIARALFGLTRPKDGLRALTILEISGCIRYEDRGEIWRNENPGAISPDASTAQNIAEDWLDRARERLASAFGTSPLRLLIPRALYHLASMPVKEVSRGHYDHWLSLFSVRLPTGDMNPQSATALVDCLFEMRVGRGGKVVAIVSTWRPFSGFRSVELLPATTSDSRIIYRMESPESPQQYISPYYFVTSTPDEGVFEGTVTPATTSYSPMVRITQNGTQAPVQIFANISGLDNLSRSSLVYSWGYWRIDQPLSLVLTSSSSSAALTQPGIYNVVLDVGRRDRSGLIPIVRTQALVYVQTTAPRVA